jgi:hypothetical protein
MKNKINISVREGERKQKWLVTLESFQKLTSDHRSKPGPPLKENKSWHI